MVVDQSSRIAYAIGKKLPTAPRLAKPVGYSGLISAQTCTVAISISKDKTALWGLCLIIQSSPQKGQSSFLFTTHDKVTVSSLAGRVKPRALKMDGKDVLDT